jgi:hypothetical protein
MSFTVRSQYRSVAGHEAWLRGAFLSKGLSCPKNLTSS